MSRCLVIIPCLNEEDHIGPLLDRLLPSAERLDAQIIVADGGSRDGTLAIVQQKAENSSRIRLMHNPRRIQSAATNAAVAQFGSGHDWFVRIDAHGGYPDDYLDRLLEEAETTGADSVVVGMLTEGRGLWQRVAAMAQNSRLGNGGSAHRAGGGGRWVDHGHHAAMRVAAFTAVGGYDESFSHNEDAELDHRLRLAGYRIWMTGKTQMTYYPRSSLKALARQYFGYGKGRAMNILKHRSRPRLRQMIPVFVAPAFVALLFAPFWPLLAIPALAYVILCLAGGLLVGMQAGRPADGPLVGLSAMVMHLAWSAGFWRGLLVRPRIVEAVA